PAARTVTVRSMLVSQSNTPNTPATAAGFEMSSDSPIPKLRGEIRFPKLEGTIDSFLYTAIDVKFVIEITPKPPQSPQPGMPLPSHVPAHSTNWNRVIGVGLIVTAGVIIVATVVEDFLTVGAGVADDPASFAAAGAAFMRGLSLVGRAAALPAAMAPA